ncbi:MAG TPA: anion transporter [Planctomycetaceae bacterium]|nr:anion transporter [Planctomycetaceae bacterium]
MGLAAGPLLAALTLWLLPSSYRGVELSAQAANVSEKNSDANTTESDSTAVQQLDSDSGSADRRMQDPQTDARSLPAGRVVKDFDWAGRATLAVMVWMGVWWLTEAIEISATALLPLVFFPLLKIDKIADAAAPYASHLIFLYLGGFIIAFSMDKSGLGRRMALLTLRLVGTSAGAMVAGFMLVTAALSGFVSNTATTAMMLPIAVSVIALLRQQGDAVPKATTDRFAACLLLSVAYAASIGGITTIIGTPTNAFLATFLSSDISPEYQIDLSFARWLPVGLSFSVVFLPIIYLMMTKLIFPLGNLEIPGGRQLIGRELKAIGVVRRSEWNTLVVFLVAVSMWLTRPLLQSVSFQWAGQTIAPLAYLSDSGIAMLCAVSLFLIPVNVKTREFTMDWATAERLPWGILLLFGGGLSLASAVKRHGVAEFIGAQAEAIEGVPVVVVLLAVTATIVFMTELTSNAATTASLVPVLAAVAPGLGIHPYLLIVPATVASSCAFMLPVATPPNAIVFGSGLITGPQMARAGFLLNLIAVLLATVFAFAVVGPLLIG